MSTSFEIQKIQRFNILRDDLIEGGTKRRVLDKILPNISEREIIYPSHPFGYGQYALALSCAHNNKECTIFNPYCKQKPDVLRKTEKIANSVKYVGVADQAALVDIVAHYAKGRDAFIMPIGFRLQYFSKVLFELTKSISFEPAEIWSIAGTGTIAGVIRKRWPKAKLNVVTLGFSHTVVSADNVYLAPEKPEEPAVIQPPYPSCPEYDAKIWRFASKYGSDDALIWNVA